MAEAEVYLVEIDRQRWPVVKFPKELLKPEDKATQTGNYKVAVLPVEKNELRWVDPYQLVLADTGDIYVLSGVAYRKGRQDLQHACEQVVEHDKTNYWIEQYRSHQLALQNQHRSISPQLRVEGKPMSTEAELEMAIRLSKEEYRRQTSNDQANAGPSGTKRTRSPSLDTDPDDDLYSSPSFAKKSRQDNRSASTRSSESSVILKDDSQSSESSLNMEKTPSPGEVRRLRDKFLMPQFTNPQQNKGDSANSISRSDVITEIPSSSMTGFPPSNKSSGLLDTLVNSTRFDSQFDEHQDATVETADDSLEASMKKMPEYSGSGSLSGIEHSAGAWTVAQDAELLRLKERTNPVPTFHQITQCIKAKFPGGACFSNRSAEHRYRRMIGPDPRTSRGDVSTNGLQARKIALAFLDQRRHGQAIALDRQNHKYTKAEDLELARLKEVEMPKAKWSEITEVFNRRFDFASRSKALSTSALYSRYSHPPSKSGQEEDQSGDSDSDSEAEEVKEDWMEGLSVPSSSTPWTTMEDAELIQMRERTEPRPSWQETVDALNRKFHGKAPDDPTRHFNNTRQRWRTIGGDKLSKSGLALRKEAFVLLGNADIMFSKSSPSSFSTEEDIELVKLRDKDMPDSLWVEIAEMFNSRMHVRPRYQERSESTLYSRYELIRSKWEEADNEVSISMLEFVQNGGMLTNSRSWTSAQDDALAKTRKNMPGKSWFEVARAFNGYCEQKDWPVRRANTIQERFNKHLRTVENDQQISYSTSTQSASGSTPRPWTRVEDKELLRLRESTLDQSWADVAKAYNRWLKMRGHGTRSSNGLQRRYQRLRADEKSKKLPFEIPADSSSTLSDSMPHSKAWTSSEDQELLRLRRKMFRESWSEVATAFVDQNRGKGWKERSGGSLSSRYEKLMESAKHNRPSNVIVIVDDDNPVPSTPLVGRLFTAEEDGELVLLREKMGDRAQWDSVTDDFNKRFPHSPRSTSSLASRYLDFLQDITSRKAGNVSQRQRAIDTLRQKGIDHQLENPFSSSSSVPSKKFTAEEDGELIRLREKFRGLARWDEIRKDYNAEFPDAPRSSGSLSSRYCRVLQETALEQLQGGVNQRERALAALRKRGIELHVNDHISDSSSEEEEESETEDESEEENNDEPDNSGTQVTILIGESKTAFTVPLSRIETNRYFLDDEYEEPTGSHLIQGHRWTAIKAIEFIPVHEFIIRGEFTPPLCPSKKSLVGVTTDVEHNMHLLRCAQVFVLARRLLMWDLAALAIYKFKLLKKGAIYLLKAAEMVFSEPVIEQETDRVMRALLVDEVAKRYWEFAGSQPTNMQDVMKKSPLFEVALYERKAEMAKEKHEKMWE